MKLFLAIWLLFTTCYFIYGQYNHLRHFVYTKGRNDVNAELFQGAYGCQPFLLEWRGETVSLVNAECFQEEPHTHDE